MASLGAVVVPIEAKGMRGWRPRSLGPIRLGNQDNIETELSNMPPILCDERCVNPVKTGENDQRTRRKRVRRRFTIGALERCEDRTLLTTIFGVTADSVLIQYDPNGPSPLLNSKSITNLGPGETIQGIDFRPATGQLYALTTDQGQTGRLYTIDPSTAVATLASTIDVPLIGQSFGIDFNPVVDRLRVVSDTGLNLRIDVGTGGAVVDAPLAYGAGDAHSGQNPNVVGSAYSENFVGAGATTLYQIDANLDVLAIQAPPNAGTLTTVGSLGLDASAVVGFDIRTDGAANVGYATLVDGGNSRLYQIDLTTGAATALKAFASPVTVTAMAVAPEGFRATVSNLTATFVGSPSIDQLVIDQAGGLLRHNQFDLGIRGYNSPFDFDSSLPGDQTLSATDPAVAVKVAARSGYDRITLGSDSAPLSQLVASFQINLADGPFNQLILDDQADETARTIRVDSAPPPMGGPGFPAPLTPAFPTVAVAVVHGFGPSVSVESSGQWYTQLSVNAGKGDDHFLSGEVPGLNAFRILLDGGAGRDTLSADARGAAVDVSLVSLHFQPHLPPSIPPRSMELRYQAFEQVDVSNAMGRALTPLPLTPTLNAVAGTTFDQALVAQFIDRDPGAQAADYDVTIQWGDGTTSKGVVIQDASDPTRFSVLGSHRYSTLGAYSITTTIVDTGGASTLADPGITTPPPVVLLGEPMPMPDFSDTLPDAVTTTFLAESPVSVSSQAVVKSAPPRVVGQLDPGSDTGLSNQDGITNDNTPAWSGASAPGSVVRIYNGTDPATRQLLASAVVDSSGAWHATAVTPLADGRYANLVAEATAVDGETRATQPLAELTVDTVGPVVANLNFDRLHGRVGLTVQDDRSGLDPASVSAQANYAFTGRTVAGPRRNRPFRITGVTATPQGSLPNARAVDLILNQGRRIRGGRFTLTVRSGGIRDLAGNALDGEFTGAFPTGNARPGGDFVARLRSFYRVDVRPSPLSPDVPNRAAKLGHGQLAHSARAAALKPRPAGPTAATTLAARFHTPGRAPGR